jgi:hypothetical protein
MSYLTLPRLYFSGLYQATPSTINNVRHNYDPSVYSNIENMEHVALVWNPMGNGGFTLKDCVVTRVDYADGTSATTAEQDPIVGQPIAAVKSPGFPVAATLVDLDVEQQGVSEIWAMVLQIGGATMGVRGDFAPAAFNSEWAQAIGPGAPRGSAVGAAVYQSTLKNVVKLGDTTPSRFLGELQRASPGALSIQFVVNNHNNSPEIFSFNAATLAALGENGVPANVVQQLQPLTKLGMGFGSPKGDLPTEQFVVFALKQRLSVDDFNAHIDTILSTTRQPYQGATPNPFTFGSLCGAVGTGSAGGPTFFVPSRMMNVQPGVSAAWYAPFSVSQNGLDVTLNLGNSLATNLPGQGFDQAALGDLWLVAFTNGDFSPGNATRLTKIDYMDPGFITQRAGIVTYTASTDLSKTPLGLLSVQTTQGASTATVLLAEDPDGWYVRADQFVFRMNPGIATSPQNPFGETATLNIYAMKFGTPAPDGTQIQLADANGPSQPAGALTVSPASQIASTSAGIASFTLTATDPGNPRGFLNGQLYFKQYNLVASQNPTNYQPVQGDIVSIQIYDQEATADAINILGQYGRLYLIMSFLADQQAIEGIDLRNMIRLLLEKPVSDVVHMPVTRDLSFASLQRITAWVDSLNNS